MRDIFDHSCCLFTVTINFVKFHHLVLELWFVLHVCEQSYDLQMV